jgi:hypothetical protein
MLRILGFLFLVVIVAAGIAGGIWYHQDRQAREFVENANSRIYADWNTDTLFRNMASVSRSPDRDAWAREFFPMMSEALGPLESSETPEGTLRYGRPAPDMPRGFFGTYISSAKFRNGNAELEFVVIKENGTWRIAAYQVSSPAILDAMSKKALGTSSGPTWDRGPPDEESAVLAEAEEILRIMDSESPGDSWNRASLRLQQSISKRRFVAKLEHMREDSGHVQSRKLEGVGFSFNRPNATPPGDYAVADFVSTYSRATLRERLGFYKQEGRWKFSAHQWNSVKEQK